MATKQYRNLQRQRILDLYGRKCSYCGYSKDERALQLDHISGNPDKKYRSGTALYIAILAGRVKETSFQILCANCNVIKKHYISSESCTNKRYL